MNTKNFLACIILCSFLSVYGDAEKPQSSETVAAQETPAAHDNEQPTPTSHGKIEFTRSWSNMVRDSRNKTQQYADTIARAFSDNDEKAIEEIAAYGVSHYISDDDRREIALQLIRITSRIQNADDLLENTPMIAATSVVNITRLSELELLAGSVEIGEALNTLLTILTHNSETTRNNAARTVLDMPIKGTGHTVESLLHTAIDQYNARVQAEIDELEARKINIDQ